MNYPHNLEFFRPDGRTASLKAGLPFYASNQWCRISGHGNKRRPRDNKCCACLALKTAEARAQEATVREMFRKADLRLARTELLKERRREAKRVAAEALKVEKAALKAQQKAARARVKRAESKAARAAQKVLAAPAVAPVVAVAVSLGVPPWEAVSSEADQPRGGVHSGVGCPWEDSAPWD